MLMANDRSWDVRSTRKHRSVKQAKGNQVFRVRSSFAGRQRDERVTIPFIAKKLIIVAFCCQSQKNVINYNEKAAN